jgi:hypothetical protein
MDRELILVYNADSGFVDIIKDAFHKTFFPSTYQCNLCALTYGTFGMKSEWRAFIDQLEIPYVFYHRDEFYKQLESHPDHLKDVQFPAIFLNKDGRIRLLIDHEEINTCRTLKDLMTLIASKLHEGVNRSSE